MLPSIRAELDALRRRHSAALELMGERDEEVHLSFQLEFFFYDSESLIYECCVHEACVLKL